MRLLAYSHEFVCCGESDGRLAGRAELDDGDKGVSRDVGGRSGTD